MIKEKDIFIEDLQNNGAVTFEILAGLYFDLTQEYLGLRQDYRKLESAIDKANIFVGNSAN